MASGGVNAAAAREAAVGIDPAGGRGKGGWEMFPLDEVGTDCVAPYDAKVPFAGMREVLVEDVVAAFEKDWAVGVVHPASGSVAVESGAVIVEDVDHLIWMDLVLFLVVMTVVFLLNHCLGGLYVM